MASAIPVPGQPGRLFIPGNNYGTTMKLSDVSMGQMDEQEQAQLNGLGDLGQGFDRLLQDTTQLRKLTDQDIDGMLKALGSRSDYRSDRRGVITFDQLKRLAGALGAEKRRREGTTKPATSTAIVPAQATALAPTQSAATAAPVTAAAGGGFAALLKNPAYWAGVAAVVGIGLYLFMRSRRSVQAVGEVETLALEGAKKPRRKRRKSKKAKA